MALFAAPKVIFALASCWLSAQVVNSGGGEERGVDSGLPSSCKAVASVTVTDDHSTVTACQVMARFGVESVPCSRSTTACRTIDRGTSTSAPLRFAARVTKASLTIAPRSLGSSLNLKIESRRRPIRSARWHRPASKSRTISGDQGPSQSNGAPGRLAAIVRMTLATSLT